MSKSHIYTFEIEVYDENIADSWPQGKYLVRGYNDVLWTNNLGQAIKFISESCKKALEEGSTK
jgi:hypothetical protein